MNGKNRYGLDTHYFKKNLKQLLRDIDNYTPTEMATALGRLSNAAKTKVSSARVGLGTEAYNLVP